MALETLVHWNQPSSEDFKNRIDFVGVFIPTDRIWRDQIKTLERYTESEAVRRFVTNFTFSSHVVSRICATFQERLSINSESGLQNFKQIEIGEKDLQDLVRELAILFGVKPLRPTMKSLSAGLSLRLVESTTFLLRLLVTKSDEEVRSELSQLEPNWNHNYRVLAENAIEIFSGYCGTSDEKWALLFDELELAPDLILSNLLDSARGSSDRLIYKLSLVPYLPSMTADQSLFSAMQGNDFEPILLWYEQKSDGLYRFFENLVTQMLHERGVFDKSLSDVIEEPKEASHEEVFARCWDIDDSFKALMKRKGIPRDIANVSPSQRAAIVRKLSPVLRVRLAHTKPLGKGKLRFRSLNRYPDLYGGWRSLATILEGNPRWIIGVMSPLIDSYVQSGETIAVHAQLDAVSKTAQKYVSMLKVIPYQHKHGVEPSSANNLIRRIGEYFQKSINTDKMELDTKNCFLVSQSVPPEVQESLGAAMNAGAIVYLPGTSSSFMVHNLIDRKFRLTYLLSPLYKLPLGLHRTERLTAVLGNEDKRQGDLLDE